jgi:hypothetical protein
MAKKKGLSDQNQNKIQKTVAYKGSKLPKSEGIRKNGCL